MRKKAMISQPMAGLSEDEIVRARDLDILSFRKAGRENTRLFLC